MYSLKITYNYPALLYFIYLTSVCIMPSYQLLNNLYTCTSNYMCMHYMYVNVMYNFMIFENVIFCVRAVYLVKYFTCIYFLCFQKLNNFLVFLRVWIWILLRKLLFGSRVVSFKSNLNSFKSKFVQIFILIILHFCKGQYPWQYICVLF